jgi:predicted nucleic acid-binding protein
MIVADTDVLIDYLNGKGEAATVERLLSRGALRTTVITRFELLSSAKADKQRLKLQQLFDAIPSLPLDDSAADAASEIRRSLEKSGIGIGMADSLIAGIVIQNNGTLLTRNRLHFERIPGLKLAESQSP